MKSKLLLLVLFFVIGTGLWAQDRTVNIRGVVVDELKEPIPGVNVLIKGTTQGTITNIDGQFDLEVGTGQVVRFSFIGYESYEVPVVKEESNLKIELVTESKGLEEVVVIGYGEVRKKDLTGSVVSLKPDEKEASKFTSVDKMLQGKMAGVNISNTTSTPGAAVSVTIRGANSLRGDNQPLYIIDNIPVSSAAEDAASAFNSGDVQIAQNPLLSLNPQDIASVEVLKDASATAIYGSRGANGVIIITTKKGKEGKAKINFNANFSLASPANLHSMLGMKDYALYKNEQANSLADTQYFIEGDEVRYVYLGEGDNYDPNDSETYMVLAAENWQDNIYRTAFSKNYGLTISGGKEKIKYYISAGYKDIEGLVKRTGMQQGTIRTNLDADLNDRLSLSLNLNASIRSNDMMQGADLLKGTAAGSITRTAIDAAPHLIPEDDWGTEFENRTTVWSWLDDYDDLTKEKTFRGSANMRYKLSKIFTYNLRAGANMRFLDRARWYGLELFKGANENGSLGITELENNNYTIENLLNYHKTFHKNFRINGVVGTTFDDYNTLNKLYAGNDFDIYALRTKGLHLANNAVVKAPIQRDYQLLSFLGRSNMIFFNGRYMATVNFRADGSSKFKKDKWGYFPSTALAWRMEEESFIKNIDFINQLKVRVGWGITGNQSIAPYSTINDYGITDNTYANSFGEKVLSTSMVRLANEDLTWETTEAYNAGIDFSFLRQRVSGSFDVYRKTTRDLLIEKNIPSSTGFQKLIVNQGSLRNQGVEFLLRGEIVKTKDFTVELGGNIAFNKGEVLDFGLPESEWGIHNLKAFAGNNLGQSYYVDPANLFAVGYEPALFWGYKTDGIIQDVEDIAYLDENGDKQYTKYAIIAGGNAPKAGDVKFQDLNGDGIVNEKDKTFIGNPNPDFTYGFQAHVTYKNLSLSMSFNGVHGKDILNANRFSEFQPGRGSRNIRQEVFNNAWRADKPSNMYPSVLSERVRTISDLIIEDGSFLRCRDITLTYELPKAWVDKMSMQNVSFFATGQNLFVLTNYKGYDPEVNTFAFDGLRQGIDWSGFPAARAYTFGFNVTF
ncbi:TonB-dependent receptor [Marinilabiliaceae bacterium JC017]|nr:TonB-dependent receptor [Marinilabiliaceae bacterium JC017]